MRCSPQIASQMHGGPFLNHSVPSASQQTSHTALFEHRTDLIGPFASSKLFPKDGMRWDDMGWHGFAILAIPRGRSLDSCHVHLSSQQDLVYLQIPKISHALGLLVLCRSCFKPHNYLNNPHRLKPTAKQLNIIRHQS